MRDFSKQQIAGLVRHFIALLNKGYNHQQADWEVGCENNLQPGEVVALYDEYNTYGEPRD